MCETFFPGMLKVHLTGSLLFIVLYLYIDVWDIIAHKLNQSFDDNESWWFEKSTGLKVKLAMWPETVCIFSL